METVSVDTHPGYLLAQFRKRQSFQHCSLVAPRQSYALHYRHHRRADPALVAVEIRPGSKKGPAAKVRGGSVTKCTGSVTASTQPMLDV